MSDSVLKGAFHPASWSTVALNEFLSSGTAQHNHSKLSDSEEWDGMLFPDCFVCAAFAEISERETILGERLR